MTEDLQTAMRLAVEAGRILMERFSGKPQIDWKGENDPVTAADRAASRFLVQRLGEAYPDDGILSEEAGDDPERLHRKRVWIVDPMDGTKEYIARRTEFTVMIGLAVEGRPELGVVCQPATGKIYRASRGDGAFLEQDGVATPLRVSPETDPARLTAALSRSHHSRSVDAVRKRLGAESSLRSGSLGLKVGLIAEGRAHFYINVSSHTCQWDTCAPEAILIEAGGRLSDLTGSAFVYNRPERRNLSGVVASNGAIHQQVVDAIAASGIAPKPS